MEINDLISRNEAIAWFFRPYSNEEYYSNLDVERALKAIPTVDAVPVVHGQWNDDDCCSECGQYVYQGDMKNYCPCCGAKMDAKHPEPVYPTWIEWLQSLGVIPYLSGYVAKRDDDGNYLGGHVDVNEVAHKPIPADIAQKLGIEPKEG